MKRDRKISFNIPQKHAPDAERVCSEWLFHLRGNYICTGIIAIIVPFVMR